MAAADVGTAQIKEETPPDGPATGDGQVVVVRPEVLDTVGHVFGNVFQRLYHLIDRVGETDALTAEELRGSTGRLEGFLQLLMDYISPAVPSLQYVTYTDVAQSFARGLSDAFGGRVRVHVNAPPGGELLVDPARLTRAFDLLSSQLQGRSGVDTNQTVMVSLQAAPRWVRLSVTLAADMLGANGSDAEMRWAVAAKLIEIHGGTLAQRTTHLGEPEWEITLPLQS